jgi:chemotaxis protein MotB
MTKQQPIYVIKRKGKHGGGHHGGAWKVAYADFVTAMMSLFIVLWLMNTSVNVRKAVAGYFNDPSGRSTETGTDRAGSGESMPLTRDNIQHLKEQLEKSITQMNDLSKLSSQIQMTVTPEGLRIELLESKDGTFFDTGSAALNENGDQILHLLAQQLGKVPNQISLEGHTDSQPFAADQSYGNWELSVDRANAARRVMQTAGVRPNQISQVRGYADQRLRMPQNPLDPSNRRISLIVQYIPDEQAPDSVKSGTPAKHSAEK